MRWIHVRGRVETDSQGRAVSFPEVTVDVTERKQAEAALREADRRKNEFLATLAHELRNPLAPIQSGIDLLRFVGSYSSSGERTLEIMERQMKHMVRLLDDLLDVSRISRGKINLRTEKVDSRMAIRSALDSALMPQKRKVSMDLTPDALIMDLTPGRADRGCRSGAHPADCGQSAKRCGEIHPGGRSDLDWRRPGRRTSMEFGPR